MGKFAVLRHEEGIRLDPDRVIGLYATLGAARAEETVTLALGEVASCLNDIGRLGASGNSAALADASRRLGQTARQIGMQTVARIAADVAGLAVSGDHTALAAATARLMRISDRSLAALWDIRDVCI